MKNRMKLRMIPVLTLLLLTGCTEKGMMDIESSQEWIPICLGSGMKGATARGVIDMNSKFTAAIAGWETSGTVDYTAENQWYNTAELVASISSQSITLNPMRYYHADNAVKTYMKGWYPIGVPSNGMVKFENTDGTVDPMMTDAIYGSKSDASVKNLVFEHLTTQIKFQVVAGQGLTAGVLINGISIRNAQIPIGFDLVDDVLMYAEENDLSVPELVATEIINSPTNVGLPIMIKPFTGNTLMLDVTTTSGSFNGVMVTIDDDTDFKPGKSYQITLTFQKQNGGDGGDDDQVQIALTASVTDWDTTGTGSATIG